MFYIYLFFITIVFYELFYSNAVHKFPVYGTIKWYCIVVCRQMCSVSSCVVCHQKSAHKMTVRCLSQLSRLLPVILQEHAVTAWLSTQDSTLSLHDCQHKIARSHCMAVNTS